MLGLYACHTCILFFTHLSHLQEHVSKNHADETCVVPSKRPRTKSPVPSVVLRSKRNKGSSCDSDSSTTNKSKKGVFYDCCQCDETFYSNANLLRHVQNVHKQPSAKPSNKIRSLAASSSGDRKWQHFSHTNPEDVGYFSSVSKQIADNLLNHVDGKLCNSSQPQESSPNEVASASVSSSVTSAHSSSSLRRSSRIQNPSSSTSALNSSSVTSSTGSHAITSSEVLSSSTPSSSLPTPKLDLSLFNFAPASTPHADCPAVLSDEEQAKLDYLQANDLQCKRNTPVVTILNDYKSFVQKKSIDSTSNELATSPSSSSSCVSTSISSFSDGFNYVCTVCSSRSVNREDFLRHWKNNHPDINCSYVKVDATNDVPSKLLLWRYNNPNGLLKSCSTATYPGSSRADTSVHCTKCQSTFKSVSLLHSHILECAKMSSSNRSQTSARSTMVTCAPVSQTSKSPDAQSEQVSEGALCPQPEAWKVIQDNPLYAFKGSPSQFHSCPYCQRGFTYLANYRKHMKGICPVRMQMEDPSKFHSSQREESADEDDPRSDTNDDATVANAVMTDDKTIHECCKCMKGFKSYFDLLKHRLSHKLMKDSSSVSQSSDGTHENGL